jgi:hypothetical protein
MEYNLSKLLRGDRKLETTRDQPGPDRLASVQCLFRIPFQSSGSLSLKTQTRQAGLEEGMELTSIPYLASPSSSSFFYSGYNCCACR